MLADDWSFRLFRVLIGDAPLCHGDEHVAAMAWWDTYIHYMNQFDLYSIANGKETQHTQTPIQSTLHKHWFRRRFYTDKYLLDRLQIREMRNCRQTKRMQTTMLVRQRNKLKYSTRAAYNNYKNWWTHYTEDVGKFTKETPGFLNIGGSWVIGSDDCFARIQRDRVMFASLNSLLKLFISDLSTSISCFSFWFSCIASLAVLISSSIFFLRSSRDLFAAMLFFFLRSQYFVSFFSLGIGVLFFLEGGSSSPSDESEAEREASSPFPLCRLWGVASEAGGVMGSKHKPIFDCSDTAIIAE